ncbi:lymphoid-specific helicase [Xylocopa sonorina]|uniref:lymphoid-specific helicase n=1 Tax=Xylocopa sonorina TaxID=1818115 RepID=UPI00403ACCC0
MNGNITEDSLKNVISNENLSEEIVIQQKKRKREELREQKRLAEEKYNQELQEQQYKRLMHLLNRSKFYSSYIVGKINNNLDKDTYKVKRKYERKPILNDENTPPQKRKQRNNEIQKKVVKDVQKTIHIDKKKLNLSTEKVENELIKDSINESNETDDIVEIPTYFNGDLRNYQKTGFQWLKILYENGINGILADEMGLGKTVQVIALLCHLIEKRQEGPYLIIAPLSTIPNWLLEFEKFAPKLPVVLFHGTSEERLLSKTKIKQKYKVTQNYSTFPIILTTFEIPIVESNFIRSLNWRYVIIDEGQRIKNHQCQLIKVLQSCKFMNKLLLTGTPLQNNLTELWSLLHFLLPEIFDDLAVFESWFDVKELQYNEGTKKFLKMEQEKHILASLREILQPFMLRREKSDVCLDVPPKKEVIVYAPLSELQHDLYKAVLNHDIDKLSKIEEEPIIYTEDSSRPRRRCTLKNIDNIQKTNFRQAISPSTSHEESDESIDSDLWKQVKSADEQNLLMWKKYTDVTERNRDFLINSQHRSHVLYKKIVNHPYLVHCPLGPDYLPKIDEELIKTSGKLLVVDAMLAKLKEQGHKVLLFSTMTSILNIIEDYLSLRNYRYVRLDGQTKLSDRKENIKQFNTDPEIFLFLISTRAGGVGLNLAGADTVIIYDSDWNPQVDIQAMARCHRIGQTRPVMIYRLCSKGTIDEKIINRAEAKRILEKMVISKHVKTINVNNKVDLLELQKLLESKECQVVTSENEVFTEEELNKLIDRSDLYDKKGS